MARPRQKTKACFHRRQLLKALAAASQLQVCVVLRLTSRFRLCKMFEKVGRLMRPLAPNFGRVDNQSHSTVSSAQLGVRSRLASHLLCCFPSFFFGYTSVVFVAISSIRPLACTVSNDKSRRNTFIETLAPASHTPAAALSSEYPRPPRTPTLEHVAQWWQESSGRHRQT